MITAILAVLKAGKTYVPLDPFHPSARNRQITRAAEAQLVIGEEGDPAFFDPEKTNIPVLPLSGAGEELPESDPGIETGAGDPACLFFTSGSTGRPKGVLHSHRSLLHQILRHTVSFGVNHEDRIALLGSGTFAQSLLSIFGSLLNGASVHLFDLHRQGLDSLPDWMESEGITILHSVPTIMRHAAPSFRGQRLEQLRYLALAGEPLHRHDVERLHEVFPPSCRLVNCYGSTELLSVAHYFIDRDKPFHEPVFPIGRPLPGVEVLLEDENGRAVAPGGTGEIVLRSRYFGLGYWRDEATTKRLYRPDPAESGMRLFHTGDLGRYDPEGNLVCLGRLDRQVQIHGQRVEPAEVESVLLAHPAVRDAAVITREGTAGDLELLAFFESDAARPPGPEELLAFVHDRLPPYMIPAMTRHLDHLPRTTSGKLDRRALQPLWLLEPEWVRSPLPEETGRLRPAPRTGGRRTCLLFLDDWGLGERLAKAGKSDGWDVIRVIRGASFSGSVEPGFTLPPGKPEGFGALFRSLHESGIVPDCVLFLWSFDLPRDGNAEETHRAAMDNGLFSLLPVVQALGQSAENPVELVLVTSRALPVQPGEPIRPERTAMTGACRVIMQEYPNITCRLIDLPPAEAGAEEFTKQTSLLWKELAAGSGGVMVAFRGEDRYEPSLRVIPAPRGEAAAPRLRPRGVYLITGGLGGIGLEIARHLAERFRARLVLIGRSAFPPPEEWDRRLEARGKDDGIGAKIQQLREIERLGGEVLVLRADVADEEQLTRALMAVRERFGRIDGVIHAARVVADESIARLDRSTLERATRPKIAGTRLLWRLLSGDPPDFIALFSSLTGWLGGLEMLARSTEAAFLDGFAHAHTGAESPFIVSIDWDYWLEAGRTAESALRGELPAWRLPWLNEGITTRRGAEAFLDILRGPHPHVLVTPRSPRTILQQAEQPGSRRETLDGRPAVRSSRPDLETAYAAPESALERELAEVWAEVLGLERVGLRDNFFALGGDSLHMTQILSRLRRNYKIDISFSDFFHAPTVAELAPHLLAELVSGKGRELPDDLARWIDDHTGEAGG